MPKTNEEIVVLEGRLREAIADEYANNFERASRFILIPDYVLEGIVTGEKKLWYKHDIRKVEEYLDKYDKKKEKK